WTITTDDVNGEIKSAIPSTDYGEVITPNLDGYTPDKTTVPEETPKLTLVSGSPVGELVQVNYVSNGATLKVTYVDTDNGNAVVGTPETLTGKTGETGKYTVTVPAGYKRADGQSAIVDYTFAADPAITDNLTIKLAHHLTTTDTTTTTRTINYTVNGKTDGAPESVVQTVNWTITTDDVNGEIKSATPSTDYGEVTTPNLDGYT
ncbi:mucin-binding protein, partial [Lacticaseibacillus camelliae]|uniref:mucin-binding protein n=1 Tax=Lacticaseibacillus camelliae TaxID=381742 RepID=UPI003B84A316